MSKRKSPQDKKRESYLHDRRNTYGENDKASRKNIPLRKRKVNRADRRIVVTDLTELAKSAGAMSQDLDDLDLSPRPRAWFKKKPDEPLGQVLKGRIERRADLGEMDIELAKRRVEAITDRQRGSSSKDEAG